MQSRLAAIVSSSYDAIIGTTLDGIITCWNAGAERIFGYDSAAAIGNPISMMAPADLAFEGPAILEKIRQDQRVDHHETVRVRKDGRTIDVALTVSPIKDSAGNIIGVSQIAQDISERKCVEVAMLANRRALEVANQALAEKNEQLSGLYQTAQRFVDDVSHEFRTPLSVIKGYSEIMRRGLAGPLSQEQTDFTQLIIERTRDLAQMVDDLLDTSKLRAGSLRVDRKPCDVATIFKAVRPSLEGRLAGSKIQWQERIEAGLPLVFADAEKASRVIVNLAVNAIKFSPEGSQVVLWARVGRLGEVEIGVTDEGMGIAPENLASIFERFRQVGNAPTTKGFGLGLNIAKELVSLNLGRISVSSEEKKGSTFSFTLPVDETWAIVGGLFGHLEERRTPAGRLALLLVTPHEASVEELRRHLACSAHPGDLILTSADGQSLVLLGYSTKPDCWHKRLVEMGSKQQQYHPSQKPWAFVAELVETWAYPEECEAAGAAMLEHISGVRVNA